MNLFTKIFSEVQLIPPGRVATYGQIAKNFREKYHQSVSPQLVGWALHQNPKPFRTPCHRVVNKNGKLAAGFAFGGPAAQAQLLLKEGVTFLNPTTVDLSKHLFSFPSSGNLGVYRG